MDPFEEFEFKPLTEGLGFHKKNAQKPIAQQAADFEPMSIQKPLGNHSTKQNTAAKNLSVDRGIDLLSEEPTLKPPLPRKTFQLNPMPTIEESTSAAVDEILKTLKQSRRLEIEEDKKQIADLKKPAAAQTQFKSTTLSLSAALLDGMLITAAFLLCMIAMLIITKVDLLNNLMNPDKEGMVYLSTLLVFTGVYFIYMTVNRIFLGCTAGEWAYDQMIGTPQDQLSISYPLKVAARVILTIATGFITLPIISLILDSDIAGKITGAQLVKKV